MKGEKDKKDGEDSGERKGNLKCVGDTDEDDSPDSEPDVKVEDHYYDDDEIIPGRAEITQKLRKVVKVIDILEFVDSCLIVSERFLKDDDEAREVIHDLREKILHAETLFTDYLITGKIPKIQ